MTKKRISLIAVCMCVMTVLLVASCGNDSQPKTITPNDYFTASDLDASYNEAGATKIILNGDSVQADGGGAEISGTTVTLTDGRTYIISGTLSDGQIIVDASGSDKPHIVLAGADITCADNPAIYIKQADKAFITLAEGTQNSVSDGSAYAFEGDETNLDAAIFSKDDLTLNGSGALTVNGNYAHGVVSKDDLVVGGGAYVITSVKSGLCGKDCVKINEGAFTITAGTDGIKSANEEDETLGYVVICGGTYNITAGKDGIQAAAELIIGGGTFNITTGGGSADASTTPGGGQNAQWGASWGMGQNQASASADTASAKGLKAGGDLTLAGAVLTIDSSDDAVHANGSVFITDTALAISSGDDGIHADSLVQVNSASTIQIAKSYEGIEGLNIEINGGNISVTSSDDGFNAAGGNDASSLNGRPGMNAFSAGSSRAVTFNGGYVYVNASGDGIDSNGSLTVNGGVILVSGPTDSGNGAIDYNVAAEINGGVFIAAGSAGMMQNFSQAGQGALLYFSASAISGGTGVSIVDKDGKVVASFTPAKNYQCVLFSAPSLTSGQSYTVYTGAAVSGADALGYAQGASFSGGTKLATVTLSKNITNYGAAGSANPAFR